MSISQRLCSKPKSSLNTSFTCTFNASSSKGYRKVVCSTTSVIPRWTKALAFYLFFVCLYWNFFLVLVDLVSMRSSCKKRPSNASQSWGQATLTAQILPVCVQPSPLLRRLLGRFSHCERRNEDRRSLAKSLQHERLYGSRVCLVEEESPSVMGTGRG